MTQSILWPRSATKTTIVKTIDVMVDIGLLSRGAPSVRDTMVGQSVTLTPTYPKTRPVQSALTE